jgi:hypothetical protein
MSNKLAIAKLAINFAAGAGVSKVVNDIIRNNTTVETTNDAFKVWTGSIVIGSMAADAGSKHVNAKVDAVVNWFEARKTAEATAE